MMGSAALTIEQAAEMLGVQAGLLQPFAVADPFHDGLPLEGFLCQKTDHRYGALVITRVADEPCPQLIHATPKLRYPFDRDGRFRFPPIARAHVYEKLDGTNVLAYRYRDAAGVVRTTFKLRLHPVLRNGTFGGFLDMWRELLARHPEAAALPTRNDCSISFELYGGRNPHLIAYDEPLALAVLFGVEPATCWNALETVDVLSFDTVRPLLLEEYEPDDVDAFRPHVEACIAAVQAELAFRARVLDAYRAIRTQGLSFPADKAAVMRLLAPRFTKGEMRRVYAALAAATG